MRIQDTPGSPEELKQIAAGSVKYPNMYLNMHLLDSSIK
jgi:hypothetical protein